MSNIFVRFAIHATLTALLIMTAAVSAQAAPRADLWDRWTAHDPASAETIDHSAWDRFLRANVVAGKDGINRIAYADVSSDDRAALDRYIEEMAAVRISDHKRAEQFAYWINLYNALTVQLVLANYPFDSILNLNISPGWFSTGPWGKKVITVEGEAVSLDDIEHRILRPIWRDPRIHYAVNCASLGCPNLQPAAFTADTMDSMLTKGARAYVNHWRGASFDGGGLYVSSIYKWFAEDFGGTSQSVITHLKTYAEAPLASKLEGVTDISGYQYDWALNEVKAGS